MARDANLHRIPSSLDLMVGGTPIGSPTYMMEMINSTVDDIKAELLQFETYTQGPNGTMRARMRGHVAQEIALIHPVNSHNGVAGKVQCSGRGTSSNY